jgi:hypothetical protein
MILSNLYGGRIRVWLDELPDLQYVVAHKVLRQVSALPSTTNQLRIAAIEYWQPTGGMAHYGLLGGKFIPNNSEELVLSIPIAIQSNDIIPWALVSKIDRVRPGLHTEFVESIIDEVVKFPNLIGGELHLDCAACGDVGSNAFTFRRLTKSLLKLFMHWQGEFSSQNLVEYIEGGNLF